MKLYRLTEVSPDGDVEVLFGWFTTKRKAFVRAKELNLERFDVEPFDGETLTAILTRMKIYD